MAALDTSPIEKLVYKPNVLDSYIHRPDGILHMLKKYADDAGFQDDTTSSMDAISIATGGISGPYGISHEMNRLINEFDFPLSIGGRKPKFYDGIPNLHNIKVFGAKINQIIDKVNELDQKDKRIEELELRIRALERKTPVLARSVSRGRRNAANAKQRSASATRTAKSAARTSKNAVTTVQEVRNETEIGRLELEEDLIRRLEELGIREP